MSVRAADRGPALLERSAELGELAQRLQAARSGRGGAVLIAGEAGIGKTALVRSFISGIGDSISVLSGACEPLFTPRALGPLFDLARGRDGDLSRALQADARPHEAASALLRDIGEMTAVAVVVEDLHWADEATLDVVKLLVRRVEDVPALLICTYRDDEVGRGHLLTRLLGELASEPAVSRIRLEGLSLAAVTQLAIETSIDPVDLHSKTGGNPFFVTEVLAGAAGAAPAAVSEAVLARAARLSEAARGVLDAVAVAPPVAEAWLLETIAPGCAAALDECLASGMLVVSGEGIAFRHELARAAVEDSLNPVQKRRLHHDLLEALKRPPNGAPDVTRLAHHAEAAGDVPAILEYAPAAGAIASRRGAHREAAAQFARAIRVGSSLDPALLGRLFERHAHETYLTDNFEPAIASGRAAVECYRRAGEVVREADALRELTQLCRCGGLHAEGAVAAQQGLALLEDLPPGPELAAAYAYQAFLSMNKGDAEGTFTWGTRGIDLAEKTGAPRALLHALNSVGTMELNLGLGSGAEKLMRSLDMALEMDLDEDVGRAYLNYAAACCNAHRFEGLDDLISAGLQYCSERGLDLWSYYLLSSRAHMALERCDWNLATDLSQTVMRSTSSILPRAGPAYVLAVVRARRGDPEWRPPLEECKATGAASGELQVVILGVLAEAEICWLNGATEEIPALTQTTYEWACRERHIWWAGALAVWRRRANLVEEAPADTPEPHRRELAGDARGAAAAWLELGCPYEAALALASAGDAESLTQAHASFLQLGARTAAAVVARRLRQVGATKIARGPRPSTLDNPAGLTARELEVGRLLREGLSNAAIAKRLYISPKTVDHHVSAIFGKLEARSRVEAANRLAGA